jgi:hypothetical protein
MKLNEDRNTEAYFHDLEENARILKRTYNKMGFPFRKYVGEIAPAVKKHQIKSLGDRLDQTNTWQKMAFDFLPTISGLYDELLDGETPRKLTQLGSAVNILGSILERTEYNYNNSKGENK